MDALRAEKAFAIQPTSCGVYRQKRPVNLREPDLTPFTGREIALVDGWIDRLRPASAAQVSNMSHQTAAWNLTNNYETIDPRSVWLAWGEPTAPQIQRGQELAAKYGLLA
jgi:hypothetical protein